jgi:predicted small lipoprotein YifL
MKNIIFLLLAVMLTGCGVGGLYISNIDKPPPDLYKEWNTPGRSVLDTKKSLLECGFKSPYSYGLTDAEDWDLNYNISLDVCMERLGYVRAGWTNPRFPICSDKRYESLRNCQPDAEIIKPNMARRLNSRYCQSPYYRNREECQP